MVYSGIAPPDELLRRASEQRNHPPAPTPSSSMPAGQLPVYPNRPPQQQQRPPQPVRPTGPVGSGQHPEDPWLDPPPSYEDAMGDNIVLAAGPRPGYNPGPDQGAQGGLFNDEKS